jgi:hypothetical protein
MSQHMTSLITPSLAFWQIARIDEECEKASVSQDIQISRGPFGAFRLMQGEMDELPFLGELSPPPTVDLEQDVDVLLGSDGSDEHVLDTINIPSVDVTIPETQQEPKDSNLDVQQRMVSTGNWSSVDDLWMASMFADVDNWFAGSLDLSRVQELEDETSLDNIDCAEWTPRPPQSPTIDFMSSPVEHSPAIPPTIIGSSVPQDAVHLLRHYSTVFIRGLTPYRHLKTPWHILFVPHAKTCLAALTLGEAMNDASLCAFYGTLALAAASLGVIATSPKWEAQSTSYKQLARHHARLMLRTAYDSQRKRAKYKSILIALLTMAQLATFSRSAGAADQRECYLLEAERFIRVKGLGLQRNKSRKVRLLHHCYVFERMQHEALAVPESRHAAHRTHVRKAIESSGAKNDSLDSLSFSLGAWTDFDEQMRRVKSKQEGENDLHLEVPGIWKSTLYPEIFGIQEIYVLLQSAIIRLGQFKEDRENTSGTGLREFMGRAKAVERRIHQLKGVSQALMPEREHLEHQPLLEILCTAMQQALTIYFYRTLYDVEPIMLQAEVAGVRDCLVRFEMVEGEDGYGSARLAWPAFIAAKEAMDDGMRMEFVNWFEVNTKRNGMLVFADLQADLTKVWAGVDGDQQCLGELSI